MWFAFSIVKLNLCLVLGILLGYYVPISTLSFGVITALFILLFILIKLFLKHIWVDIFISTGMVFIGALTVSIHNQKHHLNHYTQNISQIPKTGVISFRIKEVLKSTAYYDKYVANILTIDGKHKSGNLLLNVKPSKKALHIDDVFISKMTLNSIAPPLNPYQFNYKRYLKHQYIYHQSFTSYDHLVSVNSKYKSIAGFSDHMKRYIIKKLMFYEFDHEVIAMIKALLLGDKTALSQQVYDNYVNAGAIHILAVSGLHIGIITMLVSSVLKLILPFKNAIFRLVVLLAVLWSFAVLSGLSASVTRAVTMFSLIIVAKHIKRPFNMYNVLATSMFIILLFKPLFLFDVGFQLSYAALFSIVTFYPLLYNIWDTKSNKIIDVFWKTIVVTLTAQIGVLPFLLYYFHQFSGLSFISNLVIIPCLGGILVSGIITVILACCNILPSIFIDFYNLVIATMHTFIAWISRFDVFTAKDIPFNLLDVFIYFIVIILITQCFLNKSRFISIPLFLITILTVQGFFIYHKFDVSKETFIIFHKNKHTILGHAFEDSIAISNDFKTKEVTEKHVFKDYMIGERISNYKISDIKPAYKIKDTNILVVDSLGIYDLNTFKPDVVLLRQSPRINLNRLIDSIKPRQIIADGSNYTSYLSLWDKTCKERNIPFHSTRKSGVFMIN